MVNIQKAVDLLRQGGLVALPTETVYGLAADATNPNALKKIFNVKQRPIDHPLIVHLADSSQLSDWAIDISDTAWLLAKTFWPGPLTLILKKAPHVSDLITGKQMTVGIRIPRHPIAQTVLRQLGQGVAAPSANRYGRISPTSAQAVEEELGGAVDLILDGGRCEVGVESTIVDVSQDSAIVLRPGMITKDQIEDVIQEKLGVKHAQTSRVSGSLDSHYAPQTHLKIIQASQKNLSPAVSVALLTREKLTESSSLIHCVKMPTTAIDYAQELYKTLRELDKQEFAEIWVEEVPEGSEWDAIRDRLQRAAAK